MRSSLLSGSFLVGVIAAAFPVTLKAQARDTIVTIESGSYAGTVVPVEMGAASRKGSRFWRITMRRDGGIVGWNPSRFPIGVALRPDRGISADDSVAFWKILEQMQTDLGARVFAPVTIGKDDDPDDVIIVDTRQMASSEGMTLVTWTSNGLLYDVRVFLRSFEKLRDASVVTHEMMHALGFGHSGDHGSIMNASPSTNRLSPQDVALVQLALSSRAESENIDLWERLALVIERETLPIKH